jgi:hypothetical protein
MKLILNKNDFVNNFVGPTSKLADNLLVDFQKSEQDSKWVAKTIVNSSDNSTILIGEIDCHVTDPFRCIIPDCKTFLRLFSGITQDQIELEIESNVIKYKDKLLSFKYYLLDESYIVNKKSFSEEKLNSLSFDTTFTINKAKFSEILKFNSIIPDAEKLYFTTKDGKVLAKIGDEQKANTNEIVCETSDQFEGLPIGETIPINIQNILLMSFASENISVSVNHKLKIFKFSTPHLRYIVSGLVK